jgi:hypothetical protein
MGRWTPACAGVTERQEMSSHSDTVAPRLRGGDTREVRTSFGGPETHVHLA